MAWLRGQKPSFSVIAWVCLGALLLLVTYIAVMVSDTRTRQSATVELNKTIARISTHRAQQFSAQLSTLRNDIHFLSRIPPVKGMARAGLHDDMDPQLHLDGDSWAAQAADVYLAYLETNPSLLQARLISATTGKELVRVDRRSGNPAIVSKDELQLKDQKTYFLEALKLKQDDVYISAFNLNREYGKVEVPHTPVLRISTPVYTEDGQIYAVAVLNYSSSKFFGEITESLPSYMNAFVTNSDGDFLLHPNERYEYGFDLGQRFRWQDTFTELSTPASEQGDISLWKMPDERTIHAGIKQIKVGDGRTAYQINIALTANELTIEQSVFSARKTTLLSMLLVSIISAIFLQLYLVIKRRERQIDLQLNRQAAIVASASDAIIVTSLSGTILSWNQASARLFGYSAEEAIGGDLVTLIGHGEEDVDSLKKTLSQGQTVPHFTTPRERRDGSVVHVSCSISPVLDADGQIVAIAYSLRDITRRTVAEAKVLALNESLEQQVLERTEELQVAKERAEVASLAKSAFVANISHEIRTPMNAVLGITQLLGKSKLTADQSKHLNMLRGAGESLLILLNDILDFSKIEAGQMTVVNSSFRLNDVLNVLATIMSVNAAHKSLELVIGVEPDISENYVGDVQRLQQVLVNLVGNAIKFTNEGEVALLVDSHNDAKIGPCVRFRVRDTGIGMTQEQQAGLFAPFSQADSSITRRFGGTGLGLTISKRLVELMGGTLTLSSEFGVGTVFSANLPLTPAETSNEVEQVAGKLGELRVLVVDDNLTSCESLCKAIESWGWHATGASSGKDALTIIARAEAANNAFDILVIDWRMPDLDGLETVSAIRNNHPQVTWPMVIMVSAFEQEVMQQELGERSIDAVLVKPVTSSNLFDTLHEALAKHRGESIVQQVESIEQPLPGIRILLAEDNALNRFVAEQMLTQAGATVEMVENGELAVAAVQAEPNAFDIVLMDVQMPVMDGITATEKLRHAIQWQGPILAMTAGVLDTERESYLAAGMDGFIAKPIVYEQMVSSILQALEQHQKAPDKPSSAMPTELEQKPLPAFDVSALFALASGDQTYLNGLKQIITKTIDSAAESMARAKSAWKAGDSEQAANILHTLRGSLGTLGAQQFAHLALNLEIAIGSSSAEQIELLFERTTEALEASLVQASQWMESQN